MVAISHANAERYLRRPNGEHYIFLVFGPDQGLVVERAQSLIRSFGGSADLVELGGDAVASDPLLLLDEANSLSLFGAAHRAVRINVGGKSILPALELLVGAPPENFSIILEAGDLKRDAALRKWAESHPAAAAIECRIDDMKDLQRLIDAEIQAAGLSIEPDARQALAAMLGEDRLSTRSELSKLILYAHGQATITIEHIQSILRDASVLSTDDTLYAAFSGNRAQTIESADRALEAGVDPNVLLGAALRYSLALHRARVEIDRGSSFDDALQTVLRQVGGYGRKLEIATHLKQMKLNSIEMIAEALADAVQATRSSNFLTHQRTKRLLLSVAQLRSRA